MLPLIILFGFSVTVSILWIFGSLVYLSYNIGMGNLFTLAPVDLLSYLAVSLLPPIALWFCIGFVHYAFSMHRFGQRLHMLFSQLRRSADQSEAVIRTLLDTQTANSNVALIGNIDLVLRDLNEILADVCVRLGLLQNSAVDALWSRVGDGNVWVFCKVILANSEMNPGFERLLRGKLRNDTALVRNITEFEERFDCLISLLDESETGSFVSNTLKEGYMGRVHDSLSSVVEEISDDIAFVNKHTAFKADGATQQTQMQTQATDETPAINPAQNQHSFALDEILEDEDDGYTISTQTDSDNLNDVEEPTYYISSPASNEPSIIEENALENENEEPIISRDASQEWAHRRHDYMTSYPPEN
ncbi:MAG: hypothetical protein GY804_07805 [Alphaproteobacteria bacterium]|nr:hypothetical protein [Alphaproteobacteria bacterium]